MTPTSHTFDPPVSSQELQHDFINFQNVSVTACKLDDEDGLLHTGEDRTPIEGWTIHLLINGDPQLPAGQTGSDGCTTWSDLGPGNFYGVEEEVPPDWNPLTPKRIVFGKAKSGSDYRFTFVNTQAGINFFLYLPIMIK